MKTRECKDDVHVPNERVVRHIAFPQHLSESPDLYVHLRESAEVISCRVPERVRVVVIEHGQRRVGLVDLAK